jgi:hypothetical protein
VEGEQLLGAVAAGVAGADRLQAASERAAISNLSRATRKSWPGRNKPSLSSQGAETSGIPQASASNTRIVGIPGRVRAYQRRGTCTVARWRA